MKPKDDKEEMKEKPMEIDKRREEIREIIRSNIRISIDWAVKEGMTPAYLDLHVTEMLERLSELDCVLIKRGELPSVFNGKGEVMSALQYKQKLVGFVVTVPLVGE